MLGKLKSRFLATSVSVAALTVGLAFAQPGQKASAQVAGIGSTAAADLYNGFGVNYTAVGSGVCASGTVPDGNDFCATDVPFDPADGLVRTPVANLRIEAPVNGGDTGLSVGDYCNIISGNVTTFSDGTPITVVYRSDNSGTRAIINAACGADGSQVPGAIGVGSTTDVINTVQSTPGAIGYAEQANVNAAGATTALSSPITGPTYAIYDPNNTAVTDLINTIQSNPDQVNGLGYNPF